MHIKENLVNFLYDKKYFITLYDEFIYVFNYQELTNLSEKEIILKMPNFNLCIIGENLYVTKLLPNEILIKGTIKKVGKTYE